MHLSLLSDATDWDLLEDCDRSRAPRADAGRQHFAGLLRGLLFASALMLPFALTFGPAAFGLSQTMHVASGARN